jgi:hypothetical protein
MTRKEPPAWRAGGTADRSADSDSLTRYDAQSAARLTDPGVGIDRAMTWMGLADACRRINARGDES